MDGIIDICIHLATSKRFVSEESEALFDCIKKLDICELVMNGPDHDEVFLEFFLNLSREFHWNL